MKTWIGIAALLLLAGCADTRGVNKELPMNITQSGDGNQIEMNVSLQLESDTAGESGEARISPQTSASIYGPSQASGADALMDDLKYVIEKWMDNRKTDSDNTTTTNPVIPAEPPVLPEPPTADGGTTIDINDAQVISPAAGWKVFTTAACDDTMDYRHGEGLPSVPQDKCLFRDYSSCEQLPSSFRVVWYGANGDQEMLTVPNNCTMSWYIGEDENDFRKYRPIDDKYPHPVAYAPRGFDAVKAAILVKE
jgi:hypothetical protein